ncbi:MAG TPA: hypothetical protein ENN84_02595, partial [Candidatus Marinimicrobia bacterium]|nr:hypothetical protein [Candidatus Neomarinimicrobiota bacterium]
MIQKAFIALFCLPFFLFAELMPEKVLSIFEFENRSGDPALNYLETRLPDILNEQRLRLPEYYFTRDRQLADPRDYVVSQQIPQIRFAVLGKYSHQVLENKLLITL